jgi:hypothetical protein
LVRSRADGCAATTTPKLSPIIGRRDDLRRRDHGVVMTFGGLPVALQSPVVTVVVIVIGVVLWWNGVRFRRGRDARAVLVVFGAVACVGLWPLLLVVPVIVLQPTLVLAPARRPAVPGVAGRRKELLAGCRAGRSPFDA